MLEKMLPGYMSCPKYITKAPAVVEKKPKKPSKPASRQSSLMHLSSQDIKVEDEITQRMNQKMKEIFYEKSAH